MKLNVCLIQPLGYIHSLALVECAEYCAALARHSGYTTYLSKNRLINDGVNLVFGVHIEPQNFNASPENTIIFNTEQLPEKGGWINDEYNHKIVKTSPHEKTIARSYGNKIFSYLE